MTEEEHFFFKIMNYYNYSITLSSLILNLFTREYIIKSSNAKIVTRNKLGRFIILSTTNCNDFLVILLLIYLVVIVLNALYIIIPYFL